MKPCREIYQPIFGNNSEIRLLTNKLYNTDYVHRNCIDWGKGIGKIFFQEDGKLRLYPDEESSDWYHPENYERRYIHLLIGIQVFEFQNYLMKLGPSDEKLSKIDRRIFRYQKNSAKQFNDILIKNAKSLLKKNHENRLI